MQDLADYGVNVLAPPMQMMLGLNDRGRVVPSAYAKAAKAAGLELIGWTTERSGRIVEDVLEGGAPSTTVRRCRP